MQPSMQPIIQHLFQASSLEEVSFQRLEAFVEEYPSFGIGHYLLSRKLRSEGSERFATQAQRTNLYFTNPFWLQWQLDQVAAGNGHASLLSPAPAEVAAADGLDTAQQEQEAAGDAQEPAPSEEFLPAADERSYEPSLAEIAHNFDELPGDNLAESLADQRVEQLTAEEAGNMSAGEGEEVEGSATPAALIQESEEPSAADRLLRSIEEARGLRDSLTKINEDFTAETGVAGEGVPVEEAQPAKEDAQPIHEEAQPAHEEAQPVHEEAQPAHEEVQPINEEAQPIHDEEPPFVLDEPDTVSGVEQPAPAIQQAASEIQQPAPEIQQPAAPEQQAASAIQQSAPQAQQPERATNEPMAPTGDLVFEPYHTIDYFASQGIKLTLEENPSDALGKQLKSFTEWLKGMRRLPQKEREVVPDRVAEEAVQNFAAHSIEGKDVVTETMADVLAKQGMRDRARAVYEKLSLLNPDKRAYFAAKIEQLNIR